MRERGRDGDLTRSDHFESMYRRQNRFIPLLLQLRFNDTPNRPLTCSAYHAEFMPGILIHDELQGARTKVRAHRVPAKAIVPCLGLVVE